MPTEQASFGSLSESTLPIPVSAQTAQKATWRFKLRYPWPLMDIAIEGVNGGEEEARRELLRQMESAIVSASKFQPPPSRYLEKVANGLAYFSDGSYLPLPDGAVVVGKILAINPDTNDEYFTDAGEADPIAWQITVPGMSKRVVTWRRKFGQVRVRQEIEGFRCDRERKRLNEVPKLFPHEMAAAGLEVR